MQSAGECMPSSTSQGVASLAALTLLLEAKGMGKRQQVGLPLTPEGSPRHHARTKI